MSKVSRRSGGGTLPLAMAVALALVVGCSASGNVAVNEPPQPVPAPEPAQAPVPPAAVAADPADVRIVGDELKLDERIHFTDNSDEILPQSHGILDHVAQLLGNHPEIRALAVLGHTDNRGDVQHNQGLSARRADAVVRYLAMKGVRTPLRSAGYGPAAPVCFQNTDECHAQNRRVQFKIEK